MEASTQDVLFRGGSGSVGGGAGLSKAYGQVTSFGSLGGPAPAASSSTSSQDSSYPGKYVIVRVLLAAPARFPAAMASKYPIAEKNLLKIIFSNRNITLHAVNNKTGHIFCHASSLTPKLRQQLQEKSDEWTPSQRQATMSQKTRLVAKTFAERAQELGVPELTWERDHQPGGRQSYGGNVKVCIDTLQEGGIVFKQMANQPGRRKPDYVTPAPGWKIGSWQKDYIP